MEDKSIERLILFIEYLIDKNIVNSRYEFSRVCGLSKSYIPNMLNNKGKLSSDKILKIYDKYPELNIKWLITGKGNMIDEGCCDECSSYKKMLDEALKSLENLSKETRALINMNNKNKKKEH